jgi:ParB family chromosome partitioning protein
MARTVTATQDAIAGFHELDIDVIESSGLNPRTHWIDADDQELQDSIRVEGVLEPVMVRPHPTTPGRYQIVAGERRFRAAAAVGLGQLPAIVRELSDERLLELALTENIQRRSMHPLDEANGFIKRLDMGGCSPEALANSLGLSKRYVTDRIRLKKLIPDAAKLLETGGMTVSHAIVLAKLNPKVQKEAYCSDYEFDYDAPKRDQRKLTMRSVDELKDWVRDNVRLDLSSADAQEEFPELIEEITEAAAKGATVVMLSDMRTPWQHKAKPGDPLFSDKWEECKKTDKAAEVGIVVEGRRQGQRITFKPVAAVKRQSSSPTRSLSPEEQKRRDREAAADKRRRDEHQFWLEVKPQAIEAVNTHVDEMPLVEVIAAVAKQHHLDPSTVGAEDVLRQLAARNATISDYSVESLDRSTQLIGFDIKKWFKSQLADAKAAKTAPAKAAKKAKKR